MRDVVLYNAGFWLGYHLGKLNNHLKKESKNPYNYNKKCPEYSGWLAATGAK